MSETHSLRNVRKDHPAMLAEIAEVARIAKAGGVHFAVGLSTAFGCTIEGAVSEEQVVRLAAAAAEAGAQEFSLSDTTGYADPAQVRRLIGKVRGAVGDMLTTLHLHNTRGLGLANALAGLDEGITTLDASLGGLGGCPYAPGASGNLVTEDLVLMLNAMGLETGIDLEKLLGGAGNPGRGAARRAALWLHPRCRADARLSRKAGAMTGPTPLAGIQVIEFTHMVMGPAVGHILAGLGAEVVRVEPIGGDATRRLLGSGAGYFPMYNRGKQSICLDLKSAEGLAVARKICAAKADVLVENFRPGALDRLGLG